MCSPSLPISTKPSMILRTFLVAKKFKTWINLWFYCKSPLKTYYFLSNWSKNLTSLWQSNFIPKKYGWGCFDNMSWWIVSRTIIAPGILALRTCSFLIFIQCPTAGLVLLRLKLSCPIENARFSNLVNRFICTASLLFQLMCRRLYLSCTLKPLSLRWLAQ